MDNKHSKKKILLEDFENTFKDTLQNYTRQKVEEFNFNYRGLTSIERDEVLRQIIKVLLSKNIVIAGEHRSKQWHTGWDENFSNILKNKNLKALLPRYFGKYSTVRWKQDFILPLEEDFEWHMLAIIEYWLFEKYFKEIDVIYEFGCGTGHNLLRVREINSDAKLCGLDWAQSSQNILKKLVEEKLIDNLEGYNFNFFKPDPKIILDRDSGIYTVAALEQIGGNFIPFIDYLLENKPRICFHIEPIGEFLDKNNLVDFLSIEYFKKRNYLLGFFDYLKKLEQEKKITIHQAQRTYIGSLFVDGYSVVAWSPN